MFAIAFGVNWRNFSHKQLSKCFTKNRPITINKTKNATNSSFSIGCFSIKTVCRMAQIKSLKYGIKCQWHASTSTINIIELFWYHHWTANTVISFQWHSLFEISSYARKIDRFVIEAKCWTGNHIIDLFDIWFEILCDRLSFFCVCVCLCAQAAKKIVESSKSDFRSDCFLNLLESS